MWVVLILSWMRRINIAVVLLLFAHRNASRPVRSCWRRKPSWKIRLHTSKRCERYTMTHILDIVPPVRRIFLISVILFVLSVCSIFLQRFLPRCMECRRGLAMRILSVCPSVRPSVTRVNCDKTVERSVQIYIPYERTFSLVFSEEEWFVGGDPFYLKFWVNRPPLERNCRFWTDNRSSRFSRNT